MAKYLFEARYTAEGARGLVGEGGTARKAAFTRMIEGLGGRVEAFYFAFGDVDVVIIIDMPSAEAAAAAALAVGGSGGATARTVVLIPPEDMDKVGKTKVDYRAPGR